MGRRGHAFADSRELFRRLLISFTICVVTHVATRKRHAYKKEYGQEMHAEWTSSRHSRERQSVGIVSNSKHSLGFFLREDREIGDEFAPYIIWLLAFPESGERFIMSTMEHVSNCSTATNYGSQVTAPTKHALSIYPRHPEGPFWEGIGAQFGNKIRRLPELYVLTQTNCGGFCVDCPPEQYKIDSKTFAKSCRTTTSTFLGKPKSDIYPAKHVHKTMHLIRNPYHNAIMRFFKERELGDDQFKEEYPAAPIKGFQKWCKMLDRKWAKAEKHAFDDKLYSTMKAIPCHAEIYKFVIWHNHAFEVSKLVGKGKTKTMVVHYEDFYTKFNQTIENLIQFSRLPRVSDPYSLGEVHDYSKFFNATMQTSARILVKKLATKDTWGHIKHYF
jgi:hypothetical protein